MVHQVVINVLSDQTGRTITIEQAAPEKPQAEKEPKGKKTRKPRAKKEKTAGFLENLFIKRLFKKKVNQYQEEKN